MAKKPRHHVAASSKTIRVEWFLILLLGLLLSYVFWWPLFQGGGIIGGDTYPYYFPQKAVLADSLHAGEIPLWNPLVGFGYPVLGESQTAALYPPNLLLYSTLSLNTAYNASQILHYLLAFLATFALVKSLGLSSSGALLASTCFVFGWFPPRICLEWAIIGGAWFSAILWAGTRFLQTNARKYLVYLSLFLGMDLLAGHYNLAFITLLVLFPLPLLIPRRVTEPTTTPSYAQIWLWLSLAVITGFLVAAVQLLPTWELKQQSQRQEVNEVFAPTYGHLPPAAISQLIVPWKWHAGQKNMDQQLREATTLAVPTATNKAEANLYIGLLPLALIAIALSVGLFRSEIQLAHYWRWLALSIVGILFATGWPTYYLQDIPGIGFFRGPGRYGMVTALGLGILAGASYDAITRHFSLSKAKRAALTTLLIGLTTADMWAVSREYDFGFAPYIGRQVFYATLVDNPPINARSESNLMTELDSSTNYIRVYAPGANVPTLLNVSALPVYLGLGPEIYESDEIRVDWSTTEPAVINESMNRMIKFGVSHLILESPIDEQLWPVRFLGPRVIPLLNRTLARQEPYYVYSLNNALGTVYFKDATTTSKVSHVHVRANKVTINVECIQPEELVLTQLNYPGWKVMIDGELAEASTYQKLFRSVQVPVGKHRVEWVFQSSMIRVGTCLSVLGIIMLIVMFKGLKPRRGTE